MTSRYKQRLYYAVLIIVPKHLKRFKYKIMKMNIKQHIGYVLFSSL